GIDPGGFLSAQACQHLVNEVRDQLAERGIGYFRLSHAKLNRLQGVPHDALAGEVADLPRHRHLQLTLLLVATDVDADGGEANNLPRGRQGRLGDRRIHAWSSQPVSQCSPSGAPHWLHGTRSAPSSVRTSWACATLREVIRTPWLSTHIT